VRHRTETVYDTLAEDYVYDSLNRLWWSSEFAVRIFGQMGRLGVCDSGVNRSAGGRKWPVLWQFDKQKWRVCDVGAHVERGRSGTLLLLRSTPRGGA
jgi:hypothetical protein